MAGDKKMVLIYCVFSKCWDWTELNFVVKCWKCIKNRTEIECKLSVVKSQEITKLPSSSIHLSQQVLRDKLPVKELKGWTLPTRLALRAAQTGTRPTEWGGKWFCWSCPAKLRTGNGSSRADWCRTPAHRGGEVIIRDSLIKNQVWITDDTTLRGFGLHNRTIWCYCLMPDQLCYIRY